MKKILILDDDTVQLNFVKSLFKDIYECDTFTNPLQALASIDCNSYSCIITDLHMPVINGLTFIKKVRGLKGSSLPIFVFSNDFTIDSKLSCLELNIQDYLYSGMNKEEIFLRVKNGIMRSRKLFFHTLVIDEELLQISANEKNIEVTQIEYKILVILLRNNFEVPKKKMLNFIWPNSYVLDKTLNTHMTNLRSKIKPFGYTLVTSKTDNVFITTLEDSFPLQHFS